LEFTEIVPVSEIARNELLLVKKGQFRKGREYRREVLPKHNLSGMRSGWGAGYGE
jgi:hypothetical protein